MSSELRRQLRVALGPEITGLQRAVALEIADDARYDDAWGYSPDKGRRSKVRLAELVLWTGAKDANVVRNAIKRLSAAGWEFRVPIGRDRHGKPMYAVPGVAMTFRVPDFKGVATATPLGEGGAEATHRESQGSLKGEQGLPIGVAVATPPSLSSLGSPKESPSSSVAEVSSISLGRELEDGGGGGVSFEGPTGVGPSVPQGPVGAGPSEQTQQAEPLVAALDFRGRPPGAKQRGKLVRLVAAALGAGWSEQDLKTYLDLGGAAVQSAAAVYAHRLDRGELPDAETFRDGQRAPLVGTDALVAGWGAVAASFDTRGPQRGGYRPADPNAVWDHMERQARNGEPPDGAGRVPHCEDPDCDPITRTRQVDGGNGLKELRKCAKCHPAMRF